MGLKDHLIAYVDDERPNRIVFEQSFGARFRIKALASAAEALEFLRKETVGVLITDQRMPEMSGNELLMRVKSENPDIVRIIITAYSDLDQILAAVNDGLVSRYIIKPWVRAELEQILGWAVEEFATTRRNAALQMQLVQTERQFTTTSLTSLLLEHLEDPLQRLRAGSEGVAQAQRSLDQLTARMRSFLAAQPRAASNPDEGDSLPILHVALSICRADAAMVHVHCSYDGPASLPRVVIEATDLTHVLVDLMTNAVHAAAERPGGPGQVVISAEPEATHLVIRVIDDGCGMTPEVASSAGTPFYSTRPGAAGLGLARSRRLLERVGGSLALQSTTAGTTATCRIPLASTPSA